MSAPDPAQQTTETIYDRLGGDSGARELVGVFYASIEIGGFDTIVATHRGLHSNARSDAELHPQREMPQWHW